MNNTQTTLRKKSSVKFEFSSWVMLLLGMSIITLTWFTLRQERTALTGEVTRRGIALAQYVAAHSLDPFLTNDKLSLATLVGDVMKNEDMVYALIVDRDGRVVASNKSATIGLGVPAPAGRLSLGSPRSARAHLARSAGGLCDRHRHSPDFARHVQDRGNKHWGCPNPRSPKW